MGKKCEEIRPGDELRRNEEPGKTLVAISLSGNWVSGIDQDGIAITAHATQYEKTGRHLAEMDSLLKRIMEG